MRSVRGNCDGLIFDSDDLAKHPHEAVEAAPIDAIPSIAVSCQRECG